MDDELLFDADLLVEAFLEENVESDEGKLIRLMKEISDLRNSSDLYIEIAQNLPVSRRSFGASLSINCAIAFLKSKKYLNHKFPTWASCKKDDKGNVGLPTLL